jgi:hypothetical protein
MSVAKQFHFLCAQRVVSRRARLPLSIYSKVINFYLRDIYLLL